MAQLATVDNCILRWPTRRARRWASGFLDRVQQDANVLAVVAIGSAVRPGVASEDLDLIVIHRGPQPLRERPPLEVDLRAFRASDIDAKVAAGHDLLGWAIVFGRAMFDRHTTWRQIAKRWEGRVPLPDPAVAQDRAAEARKRMSEMHKMGDEDAAVELKVTYLSHLARGVLAQAGVHAASRPELPQQLRTVGAQPLADRVAEALEIRAQMRKGLIGQPTATTPAPRQRLGPTP